VIDLDRPLDAQPAALSMPLADPYGGASRVLVRLNGQDLGPATISERWLEIAVPASLAAGQTRLTFELRATPPDPRLRITGFRVTRGATAGRGASSYFDPETGRWWPGTFNDALGRPQAGMYLVDLRVPA
jgi:hypothetical protein